MPDGGEYQFDFESQCGKYEFVLPNGITRGFPLPFLKPVYWEHAEPGTAEFAKIYKQDVFHWGSIHRKGELKKGATHHRATAISG